MNPFRPVFLLPILLLTIIFLNLGLESKPFAAGGLCWDIRCKCHVPCGTDPPGFGKNEGKDDREIGLPPPPPDAEEMRRQKNIQEAARLNKEGLECDRRKDYECAVQKYQEALKLNSNNQTIKKNLQIGLAKRANQKGNDSFYQADYERAIRFYEESLKIDPNDPEDIVANNLRRAREALAAKKAKEAELEKQKRLAAEQEKISALVSDLSKKLGSKPPLSSDTVDLSFLDPTKPLTVDPRVVKGEKTPKEAAEIREKEFKVGTEKQLAILSVRKGDFKKALFYLMEAQKTDPKNEDLTKALILIFHLKDTQGTKNKTTPRAVALMDAFEYGRTDWKKSLDYLSAWSKASPNNMGVRDAYHFAEGLARGLEEYSNPVTFLPSPYPGPPLSKPVHQLTVKALEANMNGNFELGLRYYKQALKLAPRDMGIRDCLNSTEGFYAAQQWRRSPSK